MHSRAMLNYLRQRCLFWKPTLWGWRTVILPVISIWGLIGNIRSEFVSPADQDRWRLPILFPQVTWYWLVIALLILLIFALLEGGYRTHRRIIKEQEKRLSNLDIAWRNNERPFMEVSQLLGVGKLFEADALRKRLAKDSSEINGKEALRIILEDWRASIISQTNCDVSELPESDPQLKQWLVDRIAKLRELIPKPPIAHE